uniref:hypothetical protein n=1 Tax=Actinomadura sp. CA-154981 TaxID=3240037 RepID=UPI003F4982A6
MLVGRAGRARVSGRRVLSLDLGEAGAGAGQVLAQIGDGRAAGARFGLLFGDELLVPLDLAAGVSDLEGVAARRGRGGRA